MSLLVSTPSSVGILKLGQSSKSAAFTPLVLPARLQRSAEVEIETSWSCDGRHVQVLPSAGVKPGDTVFSYSCKGRRMQDLVAPGKRRVEKVQCIGTSDGRRELVVVDDGEVRVMQVLVDEKGAETSPKVVASYEAGRGRCTAMTSTATAAGNVVFAAGFASGQVVVCRRGSGGDHSVMLDLSRWTEGTISPDMRFHPHDSSILIVPTASSALLLVNFSPSSGAGTGPVSDDQVALLPCLWEGATIARMAVRGDGGECAVVQAGEEGRVVLVSMENPDVPTREFVVGSQVQSIAYLSEQSLVIGIASGALLTQDLRQLHQPLLEIMSTEGEPIIGLSLQPVDATRPVKAAPRASQRSTSLVQPASPTKARTAALGRAAHTARSSSVGVLGDGTKRANRGSERPEEDLRRSLAKKRHDGKSRASVSGPTTSQKTAKQDDTLLIQPGGADSTITAIPPNPMARALSRAEAKAQASSSVRRVSSTDSVRSVSGGTTSSCDRERTISGVSRAETTVSNATARDVTLPSMTSDTSVATVRANGQHQTKEAGQDPAQIEVAAEEDAWALAFIRSQDARDEVQWDEWAAELLRLRDAGAKAQEALLVLPAASPVEQLQMDLVEVQMRAIRSDRDMKAHVATSLRTMQEQLREALAVVAAQQETIENLQRQVQIMAI